MARIAIQSSHVCNLCGALCAAVDLSRVYLGVNMLNQQIESHRSLDEAWVFHTHDGAVRHARWIGEVHGETPDVVRL